MRRWEESVRTLEAALEIRESNEDAHNNLATSYFFMRNWPAAAEHYRRAIELGNCISRYWIYLR